MAYRSKPIAEGGLIPSQIGVGEAQVMPEIETSFLEKSILQDKELELTREKLEEAKKIREAKAKKDIKEDLEFKADYDKIPNASQGPLRTWTKAFRGWVTDNQGTENYESNLAFQREQGEIMVAILKNENIDRGVFDKAKDEGKIVLNYEKLDQLDDPKFYKEVASGEFEEFSTKINDLMTDVEIIEPLTDVQKGFAAGKLANEVPVKTKEVSTGKDQAGLETFTTVIENPEQYKKDLALFAEENWKNSKAMQYYYPDKQDWVDLVYKSRPQLSSKPTRRKPVVQKGKTGWNKKGGYGEVGDFIFTPRTTIIAGTEPVTEHEITGVQTTKGFPWLEITKEEITKEPGTPSREVQDYTISPLKKGSSLTKKMNILNPENPKESITVQPTRLRKDGENWFVMADYDNDTMIIPFGTISEESLAELGITVDLLEEWEGQRLSGGSTAPRTTGGTEKDPLGIN